MNNSLIRFPKRKSKAYKFKGNDTKHDRSNTKYKSSIFQIGVLAAIFVFGIVICQRQLLLVYHGNHYVGVLRSIEEDASENKAIIQAKIQNNVAQQLINMGNSLDRQSIVAQDQQQQHDIVQQYQQSELPHKVDSMSHTATVEQNEHERVQIDSQQIDSIKAIPQIPSNKERLNLPDRSSTSRPGKMLTAGSMRNPQDFNWKIYLLYNPELVEMGIDTKEKAERHYAKYGKSEGRPFKMLRVLMRYSACSGLINQQYSHIAALVLAKKIGSELVLPQAGQRDTFGTIFSLNKRRNQMRWSPSPLDGLLDVRYIQSYWKKRGLIIHEPGPLYPFPDVAVEDSAYPSAKLAGFKSIQHTRISDIYGRGYQLDELVNKTRQVVVSHAKKLNREHSKQDYNTVIVDFPCTFFMLNFKSIVPSVQDVAKSLQFSPKMKSIAYKVILGITQGSKVLSFNGLHLRVETDAQDWAIILGGKEIMWKKHISAMQQAKFNKDQDVYIATGLLSYGNVDELDNIVKKMQQAGVCRRVYYKEQYLSKALSDELTSEQKALVDLLVLLKSSRFVGFSASTFSYYIREYRNLMGIPPSSSILVDASKIGTDPMFRQNAILS